MLEMAPMTATGMVQKMHRNQMKAVNRVLISLTVAKGLMVFFQICSQVGQHAVG